MKNYKFICECDETETITTITLSSELLVDVSKRFREFLLGIGFPAEDVPYGPYDALAKALQSDTEYAYTFQSNISMAIQDYFNHNKKISSEEANKLSDFIMYRLFSVSGLRYGNPIDIDTPETYNKQTAFDFMD